MELVVAVCGSLVVLVVVVKVSECLDVENVLPLLLLVFVGVALADAELTGVVLDALLVGGTDARENIRRDY